MPQSFEITRLSQAIDQFKQRAPRDLPDGVLEELDKVASHLTEYQPIESSPGSKAAHDAQANYTGTDGTGEHYSKAAKGPDKPSPGQREAERISKEMQKAAEELAAIASGGGGSGGGEGTA